MKNVPLLALFLASLLATLGASPPPAAGQVRVETAQGVVEVSPGWRTTGTRYRAGDTARILVDLGAVEEGGAVRLALGGDVLFDFGSPAIRADAADRLAEGAHLVRQKSVGEVLVVGHTDGVGSAAANQRLSAARASSVVDWLVRNEGIPSTVLRARGMGATRPIAYNVMPDGSDNPAGRARNRRVELLIATRAGVDLEERAELVRIGDHEVDVGGGAVKVKEGSVVLGGPDGIEVTGSGVRLGGGDTIIRSGSEGDVVCASGKSCHATCPEGDCAMTCSSGADCSFTCAGGDCTMRCEKGATCNFTCAAGDCAFACADGSSCNTSCSAGGCTRI